MLKRERRNAVAFPEWRGVTHRYLCKLGITAEDFDTVSAAALLGSTRSSLPLHYLHAQSDVIRLRIAREHTLLVVPGSEALVRRDVIRKLVFLSRETYGFTGEDGSVTFVPNPGREWRSSFWSDRFRGNHGREKRSAIVDDVKKIVKSTEASLRTALGKHALLLLGKPRLEDVWRGLQLAFLDEHTGVQCMQNTLYLTNATILGGRVAVAYTERDLNLWHAHRVVERVRDVIRRMPSTILLTSGIHGDARRGKNASASDFVRQVNASVLSLGVEFSSRLKTGTKDARRACRGGGTAHVGPWTGKEVPDRASDVSGSSSEELAAPREPAFIRTSHAPAEDDCRDRRERHIDPDHCLGR